MRQYFFRSLVLCLLTVALTVPARATDFLNIETPAEVGNGQPFLIRIASPYPIKDLTLDWQGRTVKPQITGTTYDFKAMAILGTYLNTKPGTEELKVSASIMGHQTQVIQKLPIVNVKYQKETLSVPPKMVKPPKETLARIARERELIHAALKTKSPERKWDLPFTRPVKGKMLSRFGLHRTFNGDTKRRHLGLDFRAWKGTPLNSIAPGRVILTGHFYYSGNAVFVDHGNGLISLYCHMSKVLAKAGDEVKAGQTLGLSGATGRVTGAHLHLAIFTQGEVVDPEPFFEGRIVGQ